MPTNYKDNNRENKPKKSVSGSRVNAPVINLTINTSVDQITSKRTENEETNTDKNNVTINVINPPDDNTENITANRIATTANEISNRAFLVNLSIFIATAIIVIASLVQSHYASKSVELADSVFKATKAYNDSSLRIQNQSRDSASKSSQNQSERDKRLFDLQNKGLKETQNEFEIDNQAYLQIGDFDTLSLKDGVLSINYKINNLSKQPAKIMEGGYITMFDKPRIDFINKVQSVKNKIKIHRQYMYVIKESPSVSVFTMSMDRKILIR